MAGFILNRHFSNILRNSPNWVIWPYSEAHLVHFFGSSAESVGELGLGQGSKRMILSDFHRSVGPESVGFSHRQFGFVVETFPIGLAVKLLFRTAPAAPAKEERP